MRKFLIATFALGFLMPVSVTAQEFNDAQKAEIKKMFEDYLLNSGDKILQSVNAYQAEIAEKEQAEASKKAEGFIKSLEKSEDLAIAGNPDGDVTLVEFFDYNCGYCRRALDELKTVLDNDKNLKVVFMDMPILGPSSEVAARWSLAAKNQDKYFEYHQALLNHDGQKDEKTLEGLAKEVGLNIKQLKKDAESEKVAQMIDENLAQAQALGIRGTPGFIIGGDIFPGFLQANKIQDVIQEKRNQ